MKLESRTLIASLGDGNCTFTATGPSTSGIGGKGAGRVASLGGSAAAGATDGLAAGGLGAAGFADVGVGVGVGVGNRPGELHAAARLRADASETRGSWARRHTVRMRSESYLDPARRR